MTRIDTAVAGADLRVLLLCMYQQTGDHRWLEPPFQPRRNVQIIAPEDAGFSADVQDEIRRAAVEIFSSNAPPALPTLDDATLHEMMNVCLGEQIDDAYLPMLREQLGFDPAGATVADHSVRDALAAMHVIVVGAGVSGIAIGAQLTRLGVPYTIVEKNDGVGGVWFENRYPGCGVDTPNHSYAYSFGTPEPWSHYFSPQPEIRSYLERCAKEFGVAEHIRFGRTVTGARWDEPTQTWIVDVDGPDGPEVLTGTAFVSAIGQMNLPQIPDLPGADSFEGPAFHSARWPDDLDLRGKRVAVVGTGASSMQIVPTIAPDVDALTVYQRSPQWMRPMPRYKEQVSDETQWLLDHVPFYDTWFRFTLFWRYGDGLHRFLFKDPDWPHPERALNQGNDRHRQELADHLLAELDGRPDLVEKCMPTYPPYGKRMLIDNGWYETIQQPHVELVTDAVAEVRPGGIVTSDGTERACDVLVWATGFHVTDLTARLGVTGRDGVDLADEWADDDPRAHLGITVPGFPNLFCLYGPNTNLGHGGSIIFHAECQATYITDLLVQMAECGLRSVEVRREVRDAWIERVDAQHEQMIWTHPGMDTWYRNQHGRVVSVSPFRLVDYWHMTRRAELDEFITT